MPRAQTEFGDTLSLDLPAHEPDITDIFTKLLSSAATVLVLRAAVVHDPALYSPISAPRVLCHGASAVLHLRARRILPTQGLVRKADALQAPCDFLAVDRLTSWLVRRS